MKICHVISSIDKESGGTSTYMKLILEALDSDKIENHLLAFNSAENITINGSVKKTLIQKRKISSIYSSSFIKNLSKIDVELFHGNGMWEFPVHAMVKVSKKKNIPFVISSHGMLEPWALTQGEVQKKLALKLFQKNDLKAATCIHATAPMEVKTIRALGFTNPIAMIPNGVNLASFPDIIPVKPTSPKRILFLSRIH